VASLPIEERLRHYFLAMGAQPKAEANGSESGLSFNVGADMLHVAILKPADLVVRNRIIDTVLTLSSLRTSSTRFVYLAAPRLVGATLDASMFRAHGIGLLLFDDRRIDEAVPAQPAQIIAPQTTPTGNESALVTELTSLKSMYGEIERNLAQLREDMRNMQRNPQSANLSHDQARPSVALSREPVFAPPLLTPPADNGPLPSFFNNNPWLEVLSKRGRSEN
jgi:hypothetical protein